MATKRTQLEDVLNTAEDLQKQSESESDKQKLKERGRLICEYNRQILKINLSVLNQNNRNCAGVSLVFGCLNPLSPIV